MSFHFLLFPFMSFSFIRSFPFLSISFPLLSLSFPFVFLSFMFLSFNFLSFHFQLKSIFFWIYYLGPHLIKGGGYHSEVDITHELRSEKTFKSLFTWLKEALPNRVEANSIGPRRWKRGRAKMLRIKLLLQRPEQSICKSLEFWLAANLSPWQGLLSKYVTLTSSPFPMTQWGHRITVHFKNGLSANSI